MKAKFWPLLGTFAFTLPMMASPVVSNGTLTNQLYNDAGGSANYTNASSIDVSTVNDLLLGLTPIATNYVGTNETAGGNLGVLTDGQTASNPSNLGNAGLNPNEVTSASNAAFDLDGGSSPWYAEYALASSISGFDISSAVVTTGHQDFRVNQHYDVLVSSDGVNFYSLSDGTLQQLPNPLSGPGLPGVGFSYNPSGGNGGAAQTTVSAQSGNVLATGVNFVEFVDTSSGSDVYREFGVFGTATEAPEPATMTMLALGACGILFGRRKFAKK